MPKVEDSSSSEEENNRVREALDPSMFVMESTPKAATVIKKVHHDYKTNLLNVTPEFQKFVAKRLSEVLDRTIKECRKEKNHQKPDRSSGIKLFSDSTKLLKDSKFYDPLYLDRGCNRDDYSKKKKQCKRKPTPVDETDSESDLLEKASSAAVSVEWVLNKEGVKGWSKPKGKEIHTRRNTAGELEIVEPPFISPVGTSM